MTSIVIILPYFGRFPNYFNFWLQSCKNNSTIDWLIFTDNDVSIFSDCKNITFINLTFSEFRKKFENYFDFKIALDNPYKLCDFKILYGKVLKEYVANYNFWGYCDCDLIFGNIRKYATEDILSNCDKFLGHGHFSLHRTNDPQYCEMIEKTLSRGKYDYKYVFTHKENFAFDEYDHLGFSYTYLRLNSNRLYSGYTSNNSLYRRTNLLYPDYTEKYYSTEKISNERIYDDIYSDISHFRDIKDTKKGKKKILYSYNKGVLNRVILEEGKIINEEILYLHMMKRQMSICTDDNDKYYIIPNKFIEYNDNPTSNFITKHGGKRLLDMRHIKNNYGKIRIILKIGTRFRNLKIRLTNFFNINLIN